MDDVERRAITGTFDTPSSAGMTSYEIHARYETVRLAEQGLVGEAASAGVGG